MIHVNSVRAVARYSSPTATTMPVGYKHMETDPL